MVDINKYLETQLAFAQKKNEIINKKKNYGISKKSKVAAELISKKQDKSLEKRKISKINSSCLAKPATLSPPKESDDESEYLPSFDEESGDDNPTIKASTSETRFKSNTKKIIDDGDTKLFNERLAIWRKSLLKAKEGQYEGILESACVNYLLDGNKDIEENHELQNGLCVPKYIWKKLYKYQRCGVKWLWELHQMESGGLLGDEMGLGKTVQIIAFLAGLAKTDCGAWGGLGPSIIVAPATVIYQWVSHFHYWFPQLRVSVLHNSGSHMGKHNKLIADLHNSHGILVITYAGIIKYNNDLMSRKWQYIILDEGHKIRNPDTQVSKYVKKFPTPHKIIITGSPMQNSLQELWSLFDFMKPGLLGTHNAFMDHFATPITQGGYANATQLQEATALEIAKALKNIITPYLLRRTKSEVQNDIKLPEKNEQVLFCALSQEQKDLYLGYLLSGTVRSIIDKECMYGNPFRARVLVALSTLRKICNHPDLYLYEAHEDGDQIDVEAFGHWKRSGKMTVVHSLLRIWQRQGHRALIFSQSRAMICILEQYLQYQKYKYLKMDGSVSVSQRQGLIKTYNENSEYLVFLATTRVGGLGVNLTGADRVIIYDPDWNPATDSQAKERAWRIGQQRNVTVYRLLSAGTIEEKIYQRQIFKHFLSNKVLIDPNQRNVLTTSTLQGLFSYEEPNCEGDTETASLFKHTKVNISSNAKRDSNKYSNSSYSKEKLETMKKMAKAISKKITDDAEQSQKEPIEDPREKYKKKREMLLNPPKVEEPEINLIDDKITSIPFNTVLSELDIINMHAKKDYEENLVKLALNKIKEEQISEGDSSKPQENDYNKETVGVIESSIETSCPSVMPSEDVGDHPISLNKKASKRKHTQLLEQDIESLVAVKKVKMKKSKLKEVNGDDNDYVLNKLFAKANVKNALQHDVVIGLSEKEETYRLKEEATKKAREAVKALKFSSSLIKSSGESRK